MADRGLERGINVDERGVQRGVFNRKSTKLSGNILINYSLKRFIKKTRLAEPQSTSCYFLYSHDIQLLLSNFNT